MEPIKAVIHYYPRCIRLIWDSSRLYAVLAFSMNIVSAAVPAAQIWIAKIVIDTLLTTLDDRAGSPVDWIGLLTPIAAVLAVWFVGNLCGAVANGLQEQVGIDCPSMWLAPNTWSSLRRRFSCGPKWPGSWPRPDLVSVCTSPEFVDRKTRNSLLPVVERFTKPRKRRKAEHDAAQDAASRGQA